MGKNFQSLAAIQEALLKKSTTIEQLVSHYLSNIVEHNTRLNVFLEVFEQEALASARAIDAKLANGEAGRLAGLVVGIKDVICYKDHNLTCGSKILEGFESQFSATCVERLLAEDAIIIGRQNCDEFAMGSSNENSAYGLVRNGADDTTVPGGSSGGSAVAVQMDMCQVSLGSDTGGSVRQPAAFCGIYGLKPTYSRISRHGLTAYASSFDIIGILSKSIEDASQVLEVIAGPDDFDSTVSLSEVQEYSKPLSRNKKKIGFIKEIIDSPFLDPEIQQAFKKKLEAFSSAGHELIELTFPYLDFVLPTYYILTTAEASSNLSRFDGVRYGHRTTAKDPLTLEKMYKKSRTEGFGEEVLRRILLGTFVLSASYYDAFFTQAQKSRNIIKEATIKMFESCDFIASPTTPSPAFKIGQNTSDPLQMYLADLYTVQASLAGLPAISLPIDHTTNGLPIGLQLMANAFEEHQLLDFSKTIVD